MKAHALEIYALAQGIDVKLRVDVALRIIMIALFSYYGLLKKPGRSK